MPPDDMMGMMGDDEESSEPVDEFERFAAKAWPDMAGDSERMMAAKEAIKICLEADQEGEYEGGGEAPKPKKKGAIDMAFIFPGPKKKAG